MKIIVPMAGMGKRMRPHTLTIPKPLIPVAGKPIVQHLVEDITKVCHEKVDEIAFVIGDFGKEVEMNLIKIAEEQGAKGTIYYQDEPLGTAHAILCAADSLTGKVVIAFADTLFKTEMIADTANSDGIIWVSKIDDPRMFGVVKLDGSGVITDFVEKPQTFVSDLAIIGIYYIKDGDNLKKELQYLIDNDIRDKGEYQLTNALENMKLKGKKLSAATVEEWLDCGNKDATVYTNKRMLEIKKGASSNHTAAANVKNSTIIQPCFIGEDVKIENSVVGPYVSIGKGSQILNAVIRNSIVQSNTIIQANCIDNSMIGNYVKLQGKMNEFSMGDYTTEQ
ncbi:MAG TPA: sugar phosphate nucleotidyltransferase [Bacteroidia bacterium]|nr:sugar phosphate nucleotidyltransferase [Bacteroidia bacterium]